MRPSPLSSARRPQTLIHSKARPAQAKAASFRRGSRERSQLCDRCCDLRAGGHLWGVDFEHLYRTTYPRVRAYARSLTSSEADADDAVAETYLTAWRRHADIPRGAQPGWLPRVAP